MSEHEVNPPSRANVILVATNLQDHPALMIHAISQARTRGAGILLAHVVPEDRLRPGSPAPLVWEAQNALDDTVRRMHWQGIACESVVLSGHPAEQLGALAAARHVDSVIVAVRSAGGPGKSLSRSVAEDLILTVEVPVFVIGRQVAAAPGGKPHCGRILLPISLRRDRTASLDFARGLAGQTQSRLALLHVLDTSGMSARERERAFDHARLQLASVAAKETGLAAPIEVLVREGAVARTIVEEAICPLRDFIVLRSSSLSRESLFRDSIVHQVIDDARCPVITFRPPANGHRSTQELPELRTVFGA